MDRDAGAPRDRRRVPSSGRIRLPGILTGMGPDRRRFIAPRNGRDRLGDTRPAHRPGHGSPHRPAPDHRVRVDADRIVIERLVLRDPALAAIVAGREDADRPSFVERALKIGLTALQDATVSVDVDLVRDEFDKLLRSSEQANAKAAEALDAGPPLELRRWRRPPAADAREVPRRPGRAAGRSSAELFDETKRDSAIGRMRTLLGTYFDGDASKLALLLDPTRQHSPMHQFRTEVTDRVREAQRAAHRDRGGGGGARRRAGAVGGQGRRLRGCPRGDARATSPAAPATSSTGPAARPASSSARRRATSS